MDTKGNALASALSDALGNTGADKAPDATSATPPAAEAPVGLYDPNRTFAEFFIETKDGLVKTSYIARVSPADPNFAEAHTYLIRQSLLPQFGVNDASTGAKMKNMIPCWISLTNSNKEAKSEDAATGKRFITLADGTELELPPLPASVLAAVEDREDRRAEGTRSRYSRSRKRPLF